jgi:phospholipid-binding lipoprotein MlaA
MIRRVASFSFDLLRNLRHRGALALIVPLFVSACGREPLPAGINDPSEATNRYVHKFNRSMDKMLLHHAASAYGTVLPEPVERVVKNFTTNLDLPGNVVNDLLQAKLGDAMNNTLRFALNTTIGIGGLFDPATPVGFAKKSTDFGETLYVWGAKEGRYIEVPFLGPSTTRDLIGSLVDLALNPLWLVFKAPEAYYVIGAKVVSMLGDRSRYSETFDSVLYDSADSYAQLRLFYLQKRRFKLGQLGGGADTNDDTNFDDPYAK